MSNWIWNLAAKSLGRDKEALELRTQKEKESIKVFLEASSQSEVIERINKLEKALLWREFRYKHDKNKKDVVAFDLNPRGFEMLTRESWK